MRRLDKSRFFQEILLGVVFILSIPFNLLAEDVDVYAEGAYTDSDMVVYIYADINSKSILSFGVRVNYPAGLTFASATKNEDVWFFGDGTTNYPYIDPEDDGTGVVLIGGKLDSFDPTAGVTGTRVLLGAVTFTHTGMTDFSGVTLGYGRGDGTSDYKNFVATDGTVYDGAGVSFGVEIQGAPVIDDIVFEGCISELCTAAVSVTAHDPEGGTLTYAYTPLNGGTIEGSGAEVVFNPPDSGPHPCPYHIEVEVTSSVSGLSDTEVIGITVHLAGDADGSGRVDILDKRLVRDAYGAEPGDVNWDPRADVNCSGRVDILDKRVVRDQYGVTGCSCP